jgi:Uma2 family endonuclease
MATPHPVTITDWLADMPSDTEEAPWMVMPDYQLWALHLLLSILRRHRAEQRLRWYIGSELWVTLPRPGLANLDTAPDLFVAEGDTKSRTSWNIREEGQPPRFVLEVVTGASWERDTQQKRAIYDLMGVEEYAIFAPLRADGGSKLLGYHRGVFGQWQPWPAEAGGLRSRALGGLLLKVVEAEGTVLRLYDAQGRLLPSNEEAEKAALQRAVAAARREEVALQRVEAAAQREEVALQRAEAAAQREEAALRRAEEERWAAEIERQRAAAVEARFAALEAELARLRGKDPEI